MFDPLSVLNMLDVTVTSTFIPPPPTTCPPPPPFFPSHLAPLPPPLSPSLPPFVSVTNPAPYPTCGCSLQETGLSALMWASAKGRTEIVLALLKSIDRSGINVNLANVSIYQLTLSHLVIKGEGGGGLPHLISHPNPRNIFSTQIFIVF